MRVSVRPRRSKEVVDGRGKFERAFCANVAIMSGNVDVSGVEHSAGAGLRDIYARNLFHRGTLFETGNRYASSPVPSAVTRCSRVNVKVARTEMIDASLKVEITRCAADRPVYR